jgi:hypothetical protein
MKSECGMKTFVKIESSVRKIRLPVLRNSMAGGALLQLQLLRKSGHGRAAGA